MPLFFTIGDLVGISLLMEAPSSVDGGDVWRPPRVMSMTAFADMFLFTLMFKLFIFCDR